MKPPRELAKRLFDILVAGVTLLQLVPLLVIVYCVVSLRMGRPAIFAQSRPGRDGKLFTMYKFRTMTSAVDERGQLLSDAERLTPLGKFLRATSIDELPELFNVLRGEMSLVGPRPLLESYLKLYTPEQRRRHEVLPGITGWAQVNGRNAISWEQKFKLDVWYVDHHSIMLDLYILGLTMWRVVRRDGVAAAAHATMPEFLGTQTLPRQET